MQWQSWVLVLIMFNLQFSSATKYLSALIDIIRREHLQVPNCDIVSFETFETLKDHPKILQLKTNHHNDLDDSHQLSLPQSSACAILIVDFNNSDAQKVNWMLSRTPGITKSVILVLNCDEKCEQVVPLHGEKANFFASTNNQSGEVIGRVLCRPRDLTKTFMIWKPSEDILVRDIECPFQFSRRSANVTFAIMLPSVLP